MPTKLVRHLAYLTPAQQGGVVTIGNFDGVHLGHQALVKAAVSAARARGVPSIVVTFEPHAFEFFAKGPVTIPRITRLREKFTALAECGVDYVVVLKFNQELASIDASQFVSDILHQTLRPVHMIVGDDFRFGRERKGDFALLSKMGADLGFTVEAMPTLLVDGERVSSTRVRKALQAGHLAQAERLLGRPYAMLGRVCHGDKLGQKLGFPTANIYLHRRLTPVLGIYTVYMYGLSGNQQGWPGVANVGTRPTVDGTRTLLEVHLLNFNQDIYGRYVRVEYCQKLRDEERYPNLDLLKEQIARDVEAAIQYFKGGV